MACYVWGRLLWLTMCNSAPLKDRGAQLRLQHGSMDRSLTASDQLQELPLQDCQVLTKSSCSASMRLCRNSWQSCWLPSTKSWPAGSLAKACRSSDTSAAVLGGAQYSCTHSGLSSFATSADLAAQQAAVSVAHQPRAHKLTLQHLTLTMPRLPMHTATQAVRVTSRTRLRTALVRSPFTAGPLEP